MHTCNTDLGSSPSPFLLRREEVLDPLRVQVVVLNEGGVPVTGVPDPLGAPVMAVALEDDARVKLELLLAAQKLLNLGRALGEQPQALVQIVSEIIVISKGGNKVSSTIT